MSTSRLGSFLIGIAAFGLAASIIVAAVGWALVESATDNFRTVLELTDETLTSAAATLEVAETFLDTTEEGLATGGVLVTEAEDALRRMAGATNDITELVTEQVPAGIDSVRAAMPSLASTASVVDGVMRALSLVGISYAPEIPLDEAIAAIDEELADIPPLLREQQETLVALENDLEAFAGEAANVSGQLEELGGSISESRALFARYDASIEEAARLVEAAGDNLAVQRRWARLAIVALAVALAASQAVALGVGWVLRRGQDQIIGLSRNDLPLESVGHADAGRHRP